MKWNETKNLNLDWMKVWSRTQLVCSVRHVIHIGSMKNGKYSLWTQFSNYFVFLCVSSFPSSCSPSCPLPHGVETSFSRLLRRILSATSSLDLCVFSFSNMDLRRAVLALQSKGVTIRVLTDKEYAAITGSQIGVLRKAGKGNWSVYSFETVWYLCRHATWFKTVVVTNVFITRNFTNKGPGSHILPL